MPSLPSIKSAFGPISANPTNPRAITPEALTLLQESIRRDPAFMRLRPIVIDSAGTVIGGNQRLKACIGLGMVELPDGWVTRADDLTPEQRERFILIDNSPEGLSGTWDFGALSEQFESSTLQQCGILLPDLEDAMSKDGLTDPDDAPDLPAEPVTQPGDLWLMDGHRLYCGDSRSAAAVAALSAGGPDVDLFLTDPPYNVAYEGKGCERATIENDDLPDVQFADMLREAMSAADVVMRKGAAFYVWHAELSSMAFRQACIAAGWPVRQCLIWVKQSLVLGRQDYHWRHEPCLYGWKPGAAHTWEADRKQTTVLEFDRPKRSEEHPTMKPVEMFEYLIRNSSTKGSRVLDLFAGSGTTLIAAERSGRVALLMEIDPGYCDVIVRRWEAFTGKTAERVQAGADSPISASLAR
jgi:DNA modification methylase